MYNLFIIGLRQAILGNLSGIGFQSNLMVKLLRCFGSASVSTLLTYLINPILVKLSIVLGEYLDIGVLLGRLFWVQFLQRICIVIVTLRQ